MRVNFVPSLLAAVCFSTASAYADQQVTTLSTAAEWSAKLVAPFTALETELYDAVKRKDVARLDRILAPDYVLVTSARAGQPMDRRSWLNLIADYNIESFSIRDVVVRCLAPRVDADEACDLASVSVAATQIAKVGGEDRSGDGFMVDIWARRNGRWQLFSRYAAPKGTKLPKVMQPQTSQQ